MKYTLRRLIYEPDCYIYYQGKDVWRIFCDRTKLLHTKSEAERIRKIYEKDYPNIEVYEVGK